MGKVDRGKVWLGVSGLLINEKNEWLVVNKKYGGLKGKWSLPAGFVEQDETADEAIIREVKEETGLACRVKEMIGLRTGVIKSEISDNMIIFLLEADTNQAIVIEDKELDDVQFMDPLELIHHQPTSVMIQYIWESLNHNNKTLIDGINPGDQFGYTSYKLFL
ncbi:MULTISPECIES: NUDIX domain-containing protein [Cytobacillus]|uniref:NUDIX hydrolase n=1 Tax=Cytobacillus kochii TaxID=859143 RepID=A0A248TJS4_9BACI|nr:MULTISPECIES: NUDIX hydrolase [Cytobacillus]ASV68466.1 NUDIX hydrolase [Cytobacillus kochii]MDQ0187476.1 ADP-ribose pyrophosphatase YjhB (NUDIX family) [Cytobacillus kochii]MEA1855320.1 NUDIX hydrolase [Cytobacillus sp. OWB-43]MED1606310.1 NUDIX hydrolase [Cytobacillus kochii]